MSNDWKKDRADAAIKEGTDKIMKAAQALAKKETPLFEDKAEKAKKSLSGVESVDWDSLENQNLDTPLTSWEDGFGEPKSFEICLGVGLNQFFPDYVTINLTEDESNNA